MFLVIGVPIWYMTTSTYRASLPFDEIDQISQIQLFHVKLKLEFISNSEQMDIILGNVNVESLLKSSIINQTLLQLRISFLIKIFFSKISTRTLSFHLKSNTVDSLKMNWTQHRNQSL